MCVWLSFQICTSYDDHLCLDRSQAPPIVKTLASHSRLACHDKRCGRSSNIPWWLDKQTWYTGIVEYYTPLKRKAILMKNWTLKTLFHNTLWQAQRTKTCDSPHVKQEGGHHQGQIIFVGSQGYRIGMGTNGEGVQRSWYECRIV